MNASHGKPIQHCIFFPISNTCIIQVRAKTADESSAGAESPTLQRLIPTFCLPGGSLLIYSTEILVSTGLMLQLTFVSTRHTFSFD